MRGKISDQDLTNYALNDGLEPCERLYVESMLGVSEECREDVYRMLDVAQMLEEGFEAEEEEGATLPGLTAAQREKLLSARPQVQVMAFVHKTATALALAACTAFVLANPQFWPGRHTARAMTATGAESAGYAKDADLMEQEEAGLSPVVVPASFIEDEPDALIQASTDTSMEQICTPPTWTAADEPVSGPM